MTSIQNPPVTDISTAERLSEALAEVFRTAEMGDVLTDDVFLDGNPPLWRFQLQGIEAFAEWYKGYAPNGMDEVTVVRTVPTATGFVAEPMNRMSIDVFSLVVPSAWSAAFVGLPPVLVETLCVARVVHADAGRRSSSIGR